MEKTKGENMHKKSLELKRGKMLRNDREYGEAIHLADKDDQKFQRKIFMFYLIMQKNGNLKRITLSI